MTTKSLMLTLGHNSSAVFYEQDKQPIGYEEERFDKKKGSSAFPKKSIEKIIEFAGSRLYGSTVFISHWYDSFSIDDFPKKHFDSKYFEDLCRKYDIDQVFTLTEDFTHHDAHAWSSKAFESNFKMKPSARKNMYYIVADGFGNRGEVISVYRQNNGPELVERIYGYEKSLGLMYQFATAFCGMKENQDEYKFLGYEAHVKGVIRSNDLAIIDQTAELFAQKLFSQRLLNNEPSDNKLYIDLDSLTDARMHFYTIFQSLVDSTNVEKLQHIKNSISYRSSFEVRAAIGYFIQKVVEEFFTKLIEHHDIENVCLSGGCFYNVKLNHKINSEIVGEIRVMPIAGDQGAAIGIHQAVFRNFNFGDLCWGNRNLVAPKEIPSNVHVVKNETDFIQTVSDLILENQIVNVMQGNMEFGPRALCNTSTLALPHKRNTEYINKLNDRNTVMPMAPVLNLGPAFELFSNGERVKSAYGSNSFMVITHELENHAMDYYDISGVSHIFPDGKRHSARPQIIHDQESAICEILHFIDGETPCLINTSFNTHGTPILYSASDAVKDFMKQRKNDSENRAHLVIWETE